MSESSESVPPIDRRKTNGAAIASSRIYLLSAVGLSVLTVIAILAIVLAQMVLKLPVDTKVMYIIIGITAPIITGLLGAAGIGVLNVLDGHQTQLMSAIAEREHAKGLIEGLKENPNTNIS